MEKNDGKFKKGQTPWNKGMKGLYTTSHKGYKHSEETKKKLSIAHKGKRKGSKHSEETKNKISIAHKGKRKGVIPWNKGIPMSKEAKQKAISTKKKKFEMGEIIPWNKGQKGIYSEEYRRKIGVKSKGRFKGIPRTEEVKRKIGLAHKGKILSEETKKKVSETKKKQYANGECVCWMKGKKHSQESRRKLRIAQIKNIEKQFNNGQPIYPTIGKNETEILDQIEMENGITIIRQHPVAGYFVDGYDEENNVVYEVDEFGHTRMVEKDKEREENIINELNCEVIRIKDY